MQARFRSLELPQGRRQKSCVYLLPWPINAGGLAAGGVVPTYSTYHLEQNLRSLQVALELPKPRPDLTSCIETPTSPPFHPRLRKPAHTSPSDSDNTSSDLHPPISSQGRALAQSENQDDGGACVAMVGKDCVAIACDLRLGLQALTVSNNFPKIFSYGDSVYLGLTGLATDVNTVSDLFRYKVNMYRLREERAIAPTTFANLVSSSLYEKRFGPYFVSPVVAGLEPKTGKPFICGFDSIGCIDFAKDFIVSGTATEQLFGMCENLWEPDLGPDELFETISQSLLNAVDRDALSGWGAHVYIIEKDKVTKRLLKGRQD
ncbi:proteasome component pup3 [Diaporthe amygdali]|nr:proteasome component pup3 [Diaporthe amygdali]KAJ0121572.1 proteasome component pup3 [Diaporthe amygdali]